MIPAGSAANSAPATASAPSDGTPIAVGCDADAKGTGRVRLSRPTLGWLLLDFQFCDAGLEHQARGVAFDNELVALDMPALSRAQRGEKSVFRLHLGFAANLFGGDDIGEVDLVVAQNDSGAPAVATGVARTLTLVASRTLGHEQRQPLVLYIEAGN